MSVRKRGNKLETWEIALVKAMLAQANPPNAQDILAYFSRPTRSLNFRAISDIKTGAKHTAIEPARACYALLVRATMSLLWKQRHGRAIPAT